MTTLLCASVFANTHNILGADTELPRAPKPMAVSLYGLRLHLKSQTQRIKPPADGCIDQGISRHVSPGLGTAFFGDSDAPEATLS